MGIPQANTPLRPIQRTILATPVGVPVTFTFDMGQGPVDGIHVYCGYQVGNYYLVETLPPSNTFTVNLRTNLPSYVEVRTFVNWPKPGIVGSYDNGDGTTTDFTNTFYESPGAQFIYVPTNCPAIGLFATTNGLVLAGWNSGTNLQIDSSPDNVQWGEMTHVTQTGQFQIPVDGSQGQRFWRSRQ